MTVLPTLGHRLVILITKLAINGLALLLADQLLAGLSFDSIQSTVAAAVLLALVNAYLRPIVVLLTLPINILTLGLFTLVINAAMLGFVGWLLPGFHVDGFWAAVGGAVVISIISVLLNWFLNPPRMRVHVQRR